MIHQMKLYEEPFNSIKIGRKTVEVRLNDDKRRRLKVGDWIEFTKVPPDTDRLKVEIIALSVYPTFKDMYTTIPAQAFDMENVSLEEMIEQTYAIYTPAQESQWGTLAITVKRLDDLA